MIFATSSTHTGDFGGEQGANAIVQSRAAEAGYGTDDYGWVPRSFNPVIFWTNAAGGSFEDTSNWDTSIPVVEQRVHFELDETYTIDIGIHRHITSR